VQQPPLPPGSCREHCIGLQRQVLATSQYTNAALCCCYCLVLTDIRPSSIPRLYPFASAWSYTVRQSLGLRFCCIHTRRQWRAIRGYVL
jgi:hypothetical protein